MSKYVRKVGKCQNVKEVLQFLLPNYKTNKLFQSNAALYFKIIKNKQGTENDIQISCVPYLSILKRVIYKTPLEQFTILHAWLKLILLSFLLKTELFNSSFGLNYTV